MPPSKEQKAAKMKKWAQLEDLWNQGCDWKELQKRMNWSEKQLEVQMSRARKAGLDLPYRPNMGPNHGR
jgi:hypothetical protein